MGDRLEDIGTDVVCAEDLGVGVRVKIGLEGKIGV